jgi:hypothetical protein
MAMMVALEKDLADDAPGAVCACVVAVMCVLARVRFVSRNLAHVRGSAPRPRSFVEHSRRGAAHDKAGTRVAGSPPGVSASTWSMCMLCVAASPPHLRRCGVGLVLEQIGFGKPVVITQVSFRARASFTLLCTRLEVSADRWPCCACSC